MRAHASLLLVTVVVASSSVARADEAAAAEALFREGRALMKEGKLDQACRKLEESQTMDPGVGTLFNLALCYEAQGRIASAWGAYNEVAAEAGAAGQTERAQVAHDRGLVLEPRLSYATLRVQDPAPGLEVKRDGKIVGSSQWGTPIPVDPGSHAVQASAPGRQSFWSTFDVAGDGQKLDVIVPSLSVDTPPAPVNTTEKPQPAPSSSGSSLRTPLALAAVGVGVVSAGIGTYFGVQSISDHSQSNQYCQGNDCQKPGYDLRQSAISSGNFSTVFFGIGAAALLAGGAIWFFFPHARAGVAIHPGAVHAAIAW